MPSPEPTTDRELLAAYVAGDRRGAQALFARYRQPLEGFFLRRLGQRDLAEDGLQETFVRLLARAAKLVSHPKLDAWIFAVARNVAADAGRLRQARGSARPIRPDGASPEVPCTGLGASPDSRLESSELSALVRRVMDEMTSQEREVFLFRTQASLSFREIAERVQAPLNTVLSRMFRAMKRLRRELVREGWIDPGSVQV